MKVIQIDHYNMTWLCGRPTSALHIVVALWKVFRFNIFIKYMFNKEDVNYLNKFINTIWLFIYIYIDKNDNLQKHQIK